MTRAGLKWRTRPPDPRKLLALAEILVAAVVGRAYLPWVKPLFEGFVDGDRGRGHWVGFLLGISTVFLSCSLALVAGRCWRSSAVRHRMAAGLVAAAAIVALSPITWAWKGRGPRTGGEQAFDDALPGIQDGMTIAMLVSIVVGGPLYLYLADFWRRRSEGDQP